MDYVATFLAGVLPFQSQRYLYAAGRVTPDMIADRAGRNTWVILTGMFDKFSELPHPSVVKDILSVRFDAGDAAMMYQTYAAACQTDVSETEFKHAVAELVDNHRRHKTGEVLAQGYEILERGYDVGQERLEGHDAARDFLVAKLTELSRVGTESEAPEGDMRAEGADLLTQYQERKKAAESGGQGVLTGIPTLDEASGGMQRGDLTLIAAFAGAGKSAMCVQIAWHAAVQQHKNVYFGTSETGRADIINRVLARHSRLPKFHCPQGLDHKKIRRGTLDSGEEKILADVIEDLHYGDYGALHIAQVPRGSTVTDLENRMLLKHQDIGLDLALMDYLALLKPVARRQTQREEASDTLKESKVLAPSFGGGHGIPLVSPWQINRSGYEAAKTTQSYDLLALADASEAEKSADLIVSLFHDAKLSPKQAQLQVLKSRHSALVSALPLTVDYRCSYFGEQGKSAQSSTNGYKPSGLLVPTSNY